MYARINQSLPFYNNKGASIHRNGRTNNNPQFSLFLRMDRILQTRRIKVYYSPIMRHIPAPPVCNRTLSEGIHRWFSETLSQHCYSVLTDLRKMEDLSKPRNITLDYESGDFFVRKNSNFVQATLSVSGGGLLSSGLFAQGVNVRAVIVRRVNVRPPLLPVSLRHLQCHCFLHLMRNFQQI